MGAETTVFSKGDECTTGTAWCTEGAACTECTTGAECTEWTTGAECTEWTIGAACTECTTGAACTVCTTGAAMCVVLTMGVNTGCTTDLLCTWVMLWCETAEGALCTTVPTLAKTGSCTTWWDSISPAWAKLPARQSVANKVIYKGIKFQQNKGCNKLIWLTNLNIFKLINLFFKAAFDSSKQCWLTDALWWAVEAIYTNCSRLWLKPDC